MKKIFAIALALVMVLSMASAFALNNCSGAFSWTCTADVNKCGKATVELVPYVKVNNSCGGYDWQVSTCAAAVNSEKVYYAVKLTADANPDQAWYDKASVKLTFKGMTNDSTVTLIGIAGVPGNMAENDVDDETCTYYYDFVKCAWVLVDDNFEFGSSNLDNCEVKKASEAKVCAKLTSEHDGFGTWEYGDYTVTVTTTGITVTDGIDTVWMNYVLGEKITAVSTTKDSFFAKVVSDFNLGSCAVGTCVTASNIQANFGWDDEVKSCFNWSSNASAIVDADCVVAIPKTGDVSVVAYAVMAVVAAAGTMLKK